MKITTLSPVNKLVLSFGILAVLFGAVYLVNPKAVVAGCPECQYVSGCNQEEFCGYRDCWKQDCWPAGCNEYDCWDADCSPWYVAPNGCEKYCCLSDSCAPVSNGVSCGNGDTGTCNNGNCGGADPCYGVNCPSGTECSGGSCISIIPPCTLGCNCEGVSCGGQTCVVDPGGYGNCDQTQAQSCGPCQNGGTMYCDPTCSEGAQCWCTGNPNPECSGGDLSSCGVNPSCPGGLSGYWVCNQGRCEAICQRVGDGDGDGCTPTTPTCGACVNGSQQCNNSCTSYPQDCPVTSCTPQIPAEPMALRPGSPSPEPPEIFASTTVSLTINSFTSVGAWGTYCPSNNNTYTFYMDLESSPSLSTVRGVLTSNPPYANNFCGGGVASCELNSTPLTVIYGQSYKWKVTACNGPGSCRDSRILHFTVLDFPAWWQGIGGDIYGNVVQSKIPLRIDQGGFLDPAKAYMLLD